MKYLLLEILNLFKWVCVGFTLAYFMALYNGVDTNLFDNGSVTKLDPVKEYHLIKGVQGGAINIKEKETVICASCISKKIRLKGNYIII